MNRMKAMPFDDDAFGERFLEEAKHLAIAAHRARRAARAREHARHAPHTAFVIDIGPQLGFKYDGEARLHAHQEAPRGAGQVERHESYLDPLAKQRARAQRRSASRS